MGVYGINFAKNFLFYCLDTVKVQAKDPIPSQSFNKKYWVVLIIRRALILSIIFLVIRVVWSVDGDVMSPVARSWQSRPNNLQDTLSLNVSMFIEAF